MSEAKHTPGPWDVDEGDFSIYQLETGDQIAEMFGHQTPEEVEANARLMASAPDMSAEILRLRAENEKLRALLDRRDQFIVENGLWSEFTKQVDKLTRAAAAALKEMGDE